MTREEAIKTIRLTCPKISDSECDFETAMRFLIPELAKSEDERIRKFLIKLVNDGLTSFPDSLTRSDVLTYLEKQKESSWTEEDESFRKHILPRILDPKGWTMEQIEADRKLLNEFVERQKNKWGEKQKEQKPEDRFEEAREKYQVEWSEEDERMLKSTIWHISNSLTNGKNTDCKCDLTEWLKEKLKSLPMRCPKSSDNWKPSEEQMKILYGILVGCRGTWGKDTVTTMESLYQDLKKLM